MLFIKIAIEYQKIEQQSFLQEMPSKYFIIRIIE